jgi:hypothetical protein
MQTLRHDISLATYILIVLHFIRLAVRRATAEQRFNNSDDAPLPPPEGCEYKVVLFYKFNGVLSAMEFYCESTDKTYMLYSAIRSKYPLLYTSDTLFTLSVQDKLPELFHSNCTFAARLPHLTQNAMTLTFREWLSMRDDIMQLPEANWDNYRDIKIC